MKKRKFSNFGFLVLILGFSHFANADSLMNSEVIQKLLSSPKIARESFNTLVNLGKGAVPSIREMLNGKNLRLIRAALDITEKLDIATDEVRDDLTGILSNRRLGGLRVRAARLLGKLGEPWDNAIPALFSSLKDSNNRLRLAAVESLVDLASRKSKFFPELVKKLSDPENPVRKLAIESLSRYGQQISPVIPIAIMISKKEPIEPSQVLSTLLPGYFPGIEKLTPLAKEALQFIGSTDPGIGPNSRAIELQDAEAEVDGDAADAALSFEDIPAGE